MVFLWIMTRKNETKTFDWVGTNPELIAINNMYNVTTVKPKTRREAAIFELNKQQAIR